MAALSLLSCALIGVTAIANPLKEEGKNPPKPDIGKTTCAGSLRTRLSPIALERLNTLRGLMAEADQVLKEEGQTNPDLGSKILSTVGHLKGVLGKNEPPEVSQAIQKAYLLRGAAAKPATFPRAAKSDWKITQSPVSAPRELFVNDQSGPATHSYIDRVDYFQMTQALSLKGEPVEVLLARAFRLKVSADERTESLGNNGIQVEYAYDLKHARKKLNDLPGDKREFKLRALDERVERVVREAIQAAGAGDIPPGQKTFWLVVVSKGPSVEAAEADTVFGGTGENDANQFANQWIGEYDGKIPPGLPSLIETVLKFGHVRIVGRVLDGGRRSSR